MRYDPTTTMALTAGAADTKAETTTQEDKTMLTDSWVTSKAKISLFADERGKGTQVRGDTSKGVVHLRGEVDSAEAKSAAVDIAKGIDGVKSVKNDPQVVAPTARKAGDAGDSDIAKAVGTRLSKDTQLKKVTLTGQVTTIGASAKASEMARGVSGVKSVKSELTFTKERRRGRSHIEQCAVTAGYRADRETVA